MLLIRTFVAKSTVHGTGLFAAEAVPKGKTVWRFDRGRDLRMTRDELALFPEPVRADWERFAYVSRFTGLIVRAGDDYGFINHAHDPNIGVSPAVELPEGRDIALRDIAPGEELFFDYTWFGEDPCCRPELGRLPADIDAVFPSLRAGSPAR
jgi:SET domain-containing protein